MTVSNSSFLVVFLHGFGSQGDDLAPLGEKWQARLPGATFSAPNAPAASHIGSSYAWFDIDGVTDENRPARVAAARPAFDTVLAETVHTHGFAERLDRVILVGFSQGTIMALDAVASGRWPVAAVIGFSGRLASEHPLRPATATKILLVHGTADTVIPSWETEKAETELRAAGMNVEMIIEPGLDHSISIGGADRACSFLEAIVGN